MKISELLAGYQPSPANDKKHSIVDDFEVWTSNAESELLERLRKPVRLANLSEQDQFKVLAMIRKSLVTKVGHEDPYVVANEKI
jgi:hypothetical protein